MLFYIQKEIINILELTKFDFKHSLLIVWILIIRFWPNDSHEKQLKAKHVSITTFFKFFPFY